MSLEDYNILLLTGKVPATSETFISPTKEFFEDYDGVLVEFLMKPGITSNLQDVGVRDSSVLSKSVHKNMPSVTKGWKTGNAFFKSEGNQVNIGLGNGKALDIFNNNIQSYKVLST